VGITLRFKAESWVEVRDANGERLIYQLQGAGSSRAVRGTPPFRLFLGYADGVQIEVDGQPLVRPADRRLGNTARFQIPLAPDGPVGR
jgi:cytoskeleton protein RodZ